MTPAKSAERNQMLFDLYLKIKDLKKTPPPQVIDVKILETVKNMVLGDPAKNSSLVFKIQKNGKDKTIDLLQKIEKWGLTHSKSDFLLDLASLRINAKNKTPLHILVEIGDAKNVRNFCSNQNNIQHLNAQAHDGNTALNIALIMGKKNWELISRYLLEAGAKLVPNNKGETPLYLAAKNGWHNIITLMMTKENGIKEIDTYVGTETAFLAALRFQKIQVAYMLKDLGADILKGQYQGTTTLHAATNAGNLRLLKEVLDANKTQMENSDSRDISLLELPEEFTPLMCAVVNELRLKNSCFHIMNSSMFEASDEFKNYEISVQIVEILLKAGANVNCRDCQGNIPLHLAILEGDLRLVELLLKYGSDITAEGEMGLTAIQLAIKCFKDKINIHAQNVLVMLLGYPDKKKYEYYEKLSLDEIITLQSRR